jgi:hypothetical protein
VTSPAHMPTGDDNAFDSTGTEAFRPVFENSPGRKLADRYRLTRLIRRYPGEPAPEYWVGFDELLNREVGVYLVAARHPRSVEVAQAARESATVIDAHFIQILDVDSEESLCYVVTEWVAEANDLGTLVANGPMGVQYAYGIVRQLTDAVSQAHACDVTHGELKPSAVLVTAAGQIKILGLRLEAALLGSDLGPAGGGAAKQADVRAIAQLWYVALTGRWPGPAAHGLPAAPENHGRTFSPAQVRASVPRSVDRLISEVLDPEGPSYEAKTLAATIAALPRVREDDDTATRTRIQPAQVNLAPAPRIAAPGPVTPPSGSRQSSGAGSFGPAGTGHGSTGGGRGWPRGLIAAAVAAVVVIGTVAAFEFGGSGSGKNQAGGSASSSAHASATAPAVKLLTVVGDSVWDSDDGTDDEAIAPDAYDQSSTLGWSTSTYKQATDVGSYRKGTGLIFNLGSVQTVGSLSFLAAGAGATAEVWTAASTLTALPPVTNSAPPGFTRQGTQPGVGGGTVTFTFTPVTTQYVLVWFTLLPHQSTDQNHPLDGYRDNIAEVKIYS